MYKLLIRPILFRFDAESVHRFSFGFLKIVNKISILKTIFRLLFSINDTKFEKQAFGLTFKNPIGLAAGFDKNAELIDLWEDLGFGFVEIGTVTPKPQAGNDKPRLFRLPKDKAIINRMGFNNEGVKIIAERLRKRKTKIIIGGNIGKNKTTPNENAMDDYLICFEELFDCVDYFVVNVSSPNTPNLRDLQEKEPLRLLLQTLQDKNFSKPKPKPILLKIAPDLTESQLDDVVEVVQSTKIAGLIATNTTISRAELQTSAEKINSIGAGGLSGQPLKNRATDVVKYLHQKSQNAFPIIAVGGICNTKDTKEKLDAGAVLVQVYSGFVYEGPQMVKKILKGL